MFYTLKEEVDDNLVKTWLYLFNVVLYDSFLPYNASDGFL